MPALPLRGLAIALGLAAALSGPAFAGPMGTEQARHLLARTGFQPTPADLAAFERLDHAEGVERILGGMRSRAATPLPDWMGMSPNEFFQLSRDIRRERREAERDTGRILKIANLMRQQGGDAKAWWYREMLTTTSPFTERMVLFWHNHFTSSVQKARYVPALIRQNELFRREAAGNYGRLLREVARDPAMLLYLDGATSRKDRPNENFARELLELFTVGEGQYSERDIKEAARAFTGWSIDRDTGAHRVYAVLHDEGAKTFLGRSGNLDGDDIVAAVLAHPRTAERLVEKLWREFVSPHPDPAEIGRLAAILRDGDYEMKPLLRALFASAAFRDPANRGTLFKSPVELTVGTLRLLQLPIDDTQKLVRAGRLLGQDLFDPPNVKGWAGGEAWITAYSLMLREQGLQRIIQATQVTSAGRDMGRPMADNAMADKEQLPDTPVEGRSMRNLPMALRLPPALAGVDLVRLEKVVLALPPIGAIARDGEAGTSVAQMLLDPVYQLK
ncbi:MAG: DUF1800 family protein [Reyranellaceae bacterium]